MIVYIYTFPNNKKYVGQTSRTIKERANYGEGYRNSPAVYNAIKKYGWENITIETFPCASKQEMDELEKYYIQLYKTNNNNYGYNLTIGGEGVCKINRKKVITLWEKGFSLGEIAEKIKSNSNTISDILKAEKLYNAEEVEKRKIRVIASKSGEKLKEYYSIPEHQEERKKNGLKGAKARSKEVIVFKDKDYKELVGIYSSGRQCAKKLGIDHSSPSYALNHNNYSRGYYFYFLEDYKNQTDKEPKDCEYNQII